jgi:hypothetical protein
MAVIGVARRGGETDDVVGANTRGGSRALAVGCAGLSGVGVNQTIGNVGSRRLSNIGRSPKAFARSRTPRSHSSANLKSAFSPHW